MKRSKKQGIELDVSHPFMDGDFRMFLFAMEAFDNSPDSRRRLEFTCMNLGEDSDIVLSTLLSFDPHSDRGEYLYKVNDYTRKLAKFWDVELKPFEDRPSQTQPST